MQFIKKNYEKVLLGLVLVGLVAVAVFLLFLVSNEKDAQQARRDKILSIPPKDLQPPDLSQPEAFLKRADQVVIWNFSDDTNKLFNPVRWQRAADGRVFKNPVGDLRRLEVTRISPLFLIISLDSITLSDSGARFGISVELQAATRPNMRGKRTFYVSAGEKKEFGENKYTFTVREAKGPADNPSELVLDLTETESRLISISKEKPFKRADGYMADLRFAPENRTFLSRRVGDRITVAGEEYNIVAISENEVVLSAKSNQKKWTITYTSGT
jgi:hypothetical protein